jgi:hypothetical protein
MFDDNRSRLIAAVEERPAKNCERRPATQRVDSSTSQLFTGFAGAAFREMLAYSEATSFEWLLRAPGIWRWRICFISKGERA